jgi:hypothetical protein
MARTLRSFLVVVLLAVGSIHGSVAAAAATAGGQVEVGSVAKVGRFGTAIVTVRATCRDAVVADLVIDVEQGTRSGTLTGTQGLTCDGRWHRLRPEVSARLVDPAVDGPFEPGPARVDARLSLLDPETFDPLPQAFDSEIVTLLAPVEVRIGWQVKLNAGGSASVPVKARCQRPWVEPGLSVEVSQSDVHHGRVGIRGLRARLRRSVARVRGQGDPLEPVRGGHSPRSGLSHGVRPPQLRSGGPSQRLRRPTDHPLVVAKTHAPSRGWRDRARVRFAALLAAG